MRVFNKVRDAVGWWLANQMLWLTSKEYRQSIAFYIEYGQRALKRDMDEGREIPPDWRTK